MVRILIAGYHGFGNCGDEATLLAMKNNIPKIQDDITLTALSFKPEITKALYGIDAVNRFKLREVVRAILHSDIIVSGGGSLLQDETSTRSLMYYLSIILFSKFTGKKVMLYSNGIGPVSKKVNRFLIRKIISQVDMITLREESSLKELISLGVRGPRVVVTADPAFTLTGIADATADELLLSENVPLDKPMVGISIRDWKDGSFAADFAAVCDQITEQYGYTIVLLPMQYPLDIAISDKVAGMMQHKAYVLRGEYQADEILGIIGRFTIMVSMRLHALIFAGVQRVPMIGVIYDPKVAYYLDVLDMPSGGDVRKEALDATQLLACIKKVIEERGDYSDKLDTLVAALTAKGKENEQYLLEVIKSLNKGRVN